MKMEKVKIVIWDMDETFWKGTLSEGGVEKIEKNVDIVRKLVDRGIMCSVCSKNNFDDVKAVLTEWGIWDLFIFPQITWNPKGEQVKALLEKCSLRATNALFIDDNVSNLREVEFYNPSIMTSLPDILDNDFLVIPELKGKDDREHSRLKQYKVLEERNIEEQKFSSNEEFLRSSNICVSIKKDCIEHLDRIEELIQRTNQLNYTKIRLEINEIEKLLNSAEYDCAYISVTDRFGDYGIVGFYAMNGNQLEHFVFSCRTIGFGVENYIYQKLGCPAIEIVGVVSTPLNAEKEIDWIKETQEEKSIIEHKSCPKMLMIGGCDLKQASMYLAGNFDIDEEYNTVVNGYEIRTSNTTDLVNQINMPNDLKETFAAKIPFMDKDITYKSKVFSADYDIIVISLVDDFIRGIYKNKTNGFEVAMGGYFDQEDCLKWFKEEDLSYLKEEFEYTGRMDVETFISNVEFLLNHINKKSKIIFINGIDLDVSDWIGEDRVNRNHEMNQAIDTIIYRHPEVGLIDMRKIVVDRSALIKKDNRHFDRKTYYQLAQALIENVANADNEIYLKDMLRVQAENLIERIKCKFKKWGGKH